MRTNQIPRQIPDQSLYTRPMPGIIMGGVLPFGCIFIQLFFILNSIWSVLLQGSAAGAMGPLTLANVSWLSLGLALDTVLTLGHLVSPPPRFCRLDYGATYTS